MEIRVGCCGWCVRGGKKAYFKEFSVVEVQETFYKLPRAKTVSKWVEKAPENFEFAMKAWQAITHPPTSPTWRRAGIEVPRSKYNRYGFLRPTKENLKAWEKTLEICRAMEAKVCVIQTPASFKYSEENVGNMRMFLSSIKRDDVIIGWEPRGNWREHLDEVKKICDELNLIHIVDPFRCKPVSSSPIIYLRLHGIGGREVNYRYKYTDDDLEKLSKIVEGFIDDGAEKIYILFNNISMRDDALRFVKLLEGSGLSPVRPG